MKAILIYRYLLASIFSVAFIGCGPARTMNSVPKELAMQAKIPGMPNVRTWGDNVEEHFTQSLVDSIHQEDAYYAKHQNEEKPGTVDILAISGGGEHGAFGAGLLAGWSQKGDRPEFKLVTGISTGALSAPLVFIGQTGDPILKEAYTNVTALDIVKLRRFISLLRNDALGQTAPLRKKLDEWVTAAHLKAIAREHAKGRRLLIATVNLEAQRPVIWDMGAIASSGHPQALNLFHQIMVASASIPGAFEPQYFKVEAGGKRYEEMHVDGGTANQVFLWGAGVNVNQIASRAGIKVKRRPVRLYVIRNARFEPEHKYLRSLFVDIAGRAVSTLIKTQGIGDCLRLYTIARETGMEYNLISIPPAFTLEPDVPFDQKYMNALYDFGYEQGLKGADWRHTPPTVTLK